MTANVLTADYRTYIKLQLNLKRAMYRNKTTPCSDLIKDLITQIQEPALRLTEFEKAYAEWVLGLYDFDTGLDFKKLRAALGPYISTKLAAFRAAMRGRMHFSPSSRWSALYWEYRLPLTPKGETINGNQEFEPITLDQQREWVADLAETFRKKP
jgi:hypothetical protein